MHISDAIHVRRECLRRVVGRPVVNNNNLIILIGLTKDTLDCIYNQLTPVKRRYYHRNRRHAYIRYFADSTDDCSGIEAAAVVAPASELGLITSRINSAELLLGRLLVRLITLARHGPRGWFGSAELVHHGTEYFIYHDRRSCARVIAARIEKLFQERRDDLFL